MLRLVAAMLLAVTSAAFVSAAAAREPPVGEIALAQLPLEAQATLASIKRGGPFPYRRDGAVFNNRERRLPVREQGYYHEYTVPTPGARDRGARRIIAGRQGEYYYTDDHYARFAQIRE